MKLIVYVLSALLLLSCVSAGDSSKQDVDTSELQNDSHLQDALKYGCNWIFEQAANKYGISNSDIQVNQVNTIQKWEDNGNTYYSFDVEAENNDATITCQFNVKCDKDGKLSVVNKWNYNIDKKNKEEQSDSYNTETEVETYDAGTNVEINVEVDVETTVETTVEEQEEEEDQVEEVTNKCQQGDEVDASEVDNDSHLKDALNYGINWIYKKAADKYGISDSGITVNQINCICKWEDNGKTYYYFDVNTDNNDANVNATYNVKCDSDGTFDVVNKWSYTIDKNNNQEETDGYDTEEDNNDDSHDIEVDIEVTVNEEENDNNKCKDIDVSEVDNDSHLKDALIHGITWIFGKAHDKFGISNSDLVVTKINSICGYEENGNTYYSFDVEATNKDGDTVDTTYNVKCESDGKLRVVNEWKYVIHYHDTNEQETENCDNTEDQGSYTNEENSQDVEVDVEITVEEEENNNKCEQGDEVDASEIDNDSALKDALIYGVDWIFQNAANKYGVSDSTVQVTQVNCICRWEDNGKTYYSFDVEANNNDDASVDATFNVKDDGSGNLNVVNKWKYHIDYKTKKNQDKSDDCDSTEDQGTDSYENDEQDVEVDVEVNIEVNHDNDKEDCEEEDNNTDNNNDDYSK